MAHINPHMGGPHHVNMGGSLRAAFDKSQSNTSYTPGVIEVWYEAFNSRVQVWTYTDAQSWVQRGADIPVTFADGDQFGARATSDGQVKVYRNGTLLATRDVTGWPYYANDGYLGLWFINADNAVLDDLGGGTVTGTSTQTIPTTATVIRYTYDPLQRLTSAIYSGTYTYTFAYAYDAVGNRTISTQTITSALVTTYTYNAANRLTSVNGQAYTWDNNGNLKSDGSRVYSYTQANQLITVTAAGLVWSAKYNGDGARLQQIVNSAPTTYTLDLAAPLVTALTERTGATTKQYLYGLSDSPLATYTGTWTYLSGRDGLNSVRQETDANGNVLAVRGFDPYGVPLQGNGGAPFGYTGEQTDNTGLVFLRARYMQPGLGMFLSRDPWGGDTRRPLTFNGFLYAASNPINLTDPSGKQPTLQNANGYVEGQSVSISALLVVWAVSGKEVVYDFESMERAWFHYTGKVNWVGGVGPTGVCLSLLNVSVSPYVAAVWGFNRGNTIREDYTGPFVVGQAGPDIPIPIPELLGLVSAGGGVVGFSSVVPGTIVPNLDVFGGAVYFDVSAGSGIYDSPITLAVLVTSYTFERRESYSNIDQMVQDIRSGNGSPIMVPPLISDRVRGWATSQAVSWHSGGGR